MTNVKIYISGAQGPAGDSPTGISTNIHAATSKTTPADLDELGITDSAASFGLKKLTWANLKTALSTALQSVFYTETETNTLLNAKANLAGGNTFTGTQTINVGAFKDTTTTNTSSISATPDTLSANRTVTLPNASGVMALTTNANGSTSDIEVYAKAGLAINAAQVVYITGASGANVIIGLAQANDEATSSRTIGICKQNLANNGFGYVVTEGNLSGISVPKGSAVEGDPVFLSPTTPGGMVFGLANKPSAPNHMVYLGVIKTISGLNVTAIYVKVQNGYELSELSDVAISSPTSGQSLFRNGSNLWVNRAIVSADVNDATDVATANTVAKRDETGGGVYFGVSASQFGVAGEGSGYGVYGFGNGNDSIAIGGETNTGTGLSANSNSGIGASISTVTGTYHALFGTAGSNRSFVALLNGAFGWFRGAFTGRILAPATLADNVTWTLPTTGGNLARVASAAGTIVSADVSDAASAATANTLVKRDVNGGGVNFNGGSSYGIQAISTSGYAAFLQSVSSIGAFITSQSATGAEIYSNTGVGASILSASNTGAAIESTSSTAATVVSGSGTYHALFGNTGNNRSFIARVNGAFGWFRNVNRTLTIEAAATLDASRTYIIPDATGTTVPIVPPYADLTAANAAALGAGTFFWNLALKKLQVTTA